MEGAEHSAVLSIAESCVRRLLEIGLPEQQAFAARDSVLAHLENYGQRIRGGEWGISGEMMRRVDPADDVECDFVFGWNPPPGMDV